MKYTISIVTLALLMILSACGEKTTGYFEYKGETQGTFFQIQYKDTGDYRAQVDLILKQIDDGFNLWDSTSIISRLNAWKETKQIFSFQDTTHYFSAMMDASRDIYTKTNKAFDPSVLPLLKLWNFGKDISVEPSQNEIDSVLEIIGFGEFDFTLFDNADEDALNTPTYIRKTHPDKMLDFNAIVQGYTCDLIAEMFMENGINDFMVNVGGELKVGGLNPSGKKWRTGIQVPNKENGTFEVFMEVTDCGIATSGSYNKFKMINNVRHSHTIDGRIGRPVTHSLLSCTVTAPTAYEADAYATAFMVMGEDGVDQFLTENPILGLEVYLIIDNKGELEAIVSDNFPLAKE